MDDGVYTQVPKIKSRWRVLSMLCHPDKAPPEHRQKAERRFQAMQIAYKTLIDPLKRRQWDSSLPFNDKIPKDSQGTTPESFFKVYAPVFERNAQFSERQPMPKLGDGETSYDEVDRFYDAWFSFRSWRDFSYLDGLSQSDTMGRWEKREMEKENAKARAGHKKEESKRLRKLVEGAMKKDPRIAKRRQEQEEERARRKAEKEEQRRQRAEQQEKEAAKIKEEEEQERAAQEANKANAKHYKNKIRKLRSKLRKACADLKGIQSEWVERVLKEVTDGQIEELDGLREVG